MRTSAAIKAGQNKPPEVLQELDVNRHWRVEGRSREHYDVWRSASDQRFFECTCPSRGLCRHITAVVKSLAASKGWEAVSVWTDEADAKRQNKRTLQLYAMGKAFWVTYSWGSWVPREDEARLVGVKADQWRKDIWDAFYKVEGEPRVYRRPVRRER